MHTYTLSLHRFFLVKINIFLTSPLAAHLKTQEKLRELQEAQSELQEQYKSAQQALRQKTAEQEYLVRLFCCSNFTN